VGRERKVEGRANIGKEVLRLAMCGIREFQGQSDLGDFGAFLQFCRSKVERLESIHMKVF